MPWLNAASSASVPLRREGSCSGGLLALADRYRAGILGGLVLLYLIGFNGQWHIEPDSALYLSIARNLAEGRGYVYHGHVEALAYPGWPLLLAGTFAVFGVDNLWPAHVLMLLMALAALGLTYRLFLLHGGRPLAVVMTALVGLNENLYQYAYQLRNDVPFLVGVLATLIGYEAIVRSAGGEALAAEPARGPVRWWDWALFPIGLLVCAVMRPTMLAFLPCVALAVAWVVWRGRGHWGRAGVVVLVILVGVGFFLLDPRRHASANTLGGYEDEVFSIFTQSERLSAMLKRSGREYLPQLVKSTTVAALGHQLGPGLDLIPMLGLLVLGVGLMRRRPLWGLWVAATFAMMLLTIPRDRYFLPILPLLAFAWWWGASYLNRRLPGQWGNGAFVLLLTLWVGINSVRVGNVILDQHHRPFLTYYKSGRYQTVAELGATIERLVPEEGMVLAPAKHGRIVTWFSRRRVLDRWEWETASPDKGPVFVVLPPEGKEDPLMAYLQGRGWKVGQELARVSRSYRGQPIAPWTVHEVQQ